MTFHNNPAIVKLNMLERREREGEREKERQKERYREGGRDKRERENIDRITIQEG